ncbi:MAG: hypothetical protein OEW11_11635, partial [Nitrospirota bacterium]|nr:hypothetical protein [Nitrospirota bacterium]
GLYGLLADYGENYVKLFLWMLGTILLGASLAALVDASFTVDGFTAIVTSAFHSTIIAGTHLKMASIGMLPFSTSKAVNWENVHGLALLVFAVEGMVLYTLAALFVMAVNRRFRR